MVRVAYPPFLIGDTIFNNNVNVSDCLATKLFTSCKIIYNTLPELWIDDGGIITFMSLQVPVG